MSDEKKDEKKKRKKPSKAEADPPSDAAKGEIRVHLEFTGDGEEGQSHSVEHPPQPGAALVLPDQVLPTSLFVVPLNSSVVYPSLMAPLNVAIPKFVATVEEVSRRQNLIGLILHRKGPISNKTKADDLHQVGVIAKILKKIKLPDGSVNLLVHSIKRFRVKKVLTGDPHVVVEPTYLEDVVEKSKELDALNRAVISHVKALSDVNPFFTEELKLAMLNAPGKGTVADLVAFALSLPKKEGQEFLEVLSVKQRFEKLLYFLKREEDVSSLQRKIQEDVNSKINTMQREFFLKEQLKAIRRELGQEEDGKDRASRDFRKKIAELDLPEEAGKVALEEVEKFETLSEQSPEYNISRNYLELICSLPWNKETKDNLDLAHSRKVLDEDHYGLERVKDRIIEFMAVRKLLADKAKKTEKSAKGSIICLVGPPGVGKTSVGKSIARSLGREFYRFSLGGMRDEAEIKGHRRTYIGAMPGKIIQAVRRAGTKNAVIMLDEIDKLGMSFQGDPASALLEVLDPEQNSSFVDHYLDVPFDLSKVLFIATGNTLSTIPGPLLDRMEVIELPGYTLEEKEKIASRYVIPKVLKENGLRSVDVRVRPDALRSIMLDYSREPGMRSLQQLMGRIARKAAAKIVGRKSRPSGPAPIVVQKDDLADWLGPKRFYNEIAERITAPGVVVGLAWTSTGGDVLFIEAADIPGAGQMKLTGQMGDVMTESASIAWSYIKKKLAADGRVSVGDFKKKDIHLHIPAGAIPKDGPSAGITMAVALYSLFTGRVFKPRLAMTGELSLTGKVLPVGGIKEKLLAAKRVGVNTVIMPRLNQKDMTEVPDYAIKGMKIHWVSHVEEVFDLALKLKEQPKGTPRQKSTRNYSPGRQPVLVAAENDAETQPEPRAKKRRRKKRRKRRR